VIEKIGFFHFGSNHGDPIGSLRSALNARKKDVPESLIVLPEAFNIGQDYWAPSGAQQSDPRIRDCLQRICNEFNMSVVAGLIIDTFEDSKIYSAAYLINSVSEPVRLCVKQGNDGRGYGEKAYPGYTPYYTPSLDDRYNPTLYLNLCITTLICMDAFPDSRKRHKQLQEKLGGDKCAYHVVCIPAHIKNGGRDGIAENWRNSYVVCANSNVTECQQGGLGSFVVWVDGDGNIKMPANEEWQLSGNTSEIRVVNCAPR
jgi:hypothetical protein